MQVDSLPAEPPGKPSLSLVVYICQPQSPSLSHPLPSLSICEFVLYLHVSISALQISSSDKKKKERITTLCIRIKHVMLNKKVWVDRWTHSQNNGEIIY